jgi:hypothetical protein
LREGDELLVRKSQVLAELGTADRSPKHGSEPFGSTEQIDVLSDKAGIRLRSIICDQSKNANMLRFGING